MRAAATTRGRVPHSLVVVPLRIYRENGNQSPVIRLVTTVPAWGTVPAPGTIPARGSVPARWTARPLTRTGNAMCSCLIQRGGRSGRASFSLEGWTDINSLSPRTTSARGRTCTAHHRSRASPERKVTTVPARGTVPALETVPTRGSVRLLSLEEVRVRV